MNSATNLIVDQLYLFSANIKPERESKAAAFSLREFHIRPTSETKDLFEAPTVEPFVT